MGLWLEVHDGVAKGKKAKKDDAQKEVARREASVAGQVRETRARESRELKNAVEAGLATDLLGKMGAVDAKKEIAASTKATPSGVEEAVAMLGAIVLVRDDRVGFWRGVIVEITFGIDVYGRCPAVDGFDAAGASPLTP